MVASHKLKRLRGIRSRQRDLAASGHARAQIQLADAKKQADNAVASYLRTAGRQTSIDEIIEAHAYIHAAERNVNLAKNHEVMEQQRLTEAAFALRRAERVLDQTTQTESRTADRNEQREADEHAKRPKQ